MCRCLRKPSNYNKITGILECISFSWVLYLSINLLKSENWFCRGIYELKFLNIDFRLLKSVVTSVFELCFRLEINQHISIEHTLNLCTLLWEKYMQFACMNNKRCIAYQNYTLFACNWGACKACVNIYTRVSLAFYARVSGAIPAACTVPLHFTDLSLLPSMVLNSMVTCTTKNVARAAWLQHWSCSCMNFTLKEI